MNIDNILNEIEIVKTADVYAIFDQKNHSATKYSPIQRLKI